MSRGDQRERDRAKKQAKLNQQKAKRDGDPQQRNANDAAKLQAKVAAKKLKEGANAVPVSSGPVPRKRVPKKKEDTMDDMLMAGLSASKKKGGKK